MADADLTADLATEPLQPLLSELKEGLRALYGERLVRVVLYGSQARGDADEDSDVDILVVLEGLFERSEEIKRTSQLAPRAARFIELAQTQLGKPQTQT